MKITSPEKLYTKKQFTRLCFKATQDMRKFHSEGKSLFDWFLSLPIETLLSFETFTFEGKDEILNTDKLNITGVVVFLTMMALQISQNTDKFSEDDVFNGTNAFLQLAVEALMVHRGMLKYKKLEEWFNINDRPEFEFTDEAEKLLDCAKNITSLLKEGEDESNPS